MWVKMLSPMIVVAFLAGTAALVYAEDGATEGLGRTAPGIYPADRSGPASPSSAVGGYSALGAGDTAVGNWTGTNSGVNRRQTGGYSVSAPNYGGSTVAPVVPGGNGALGAGDSAIGNWTGANPGIDRRPSGSSYYGRGLR